MRLGSEVYYLRMGSKQLQYLVAIVVYGTSAFPAEVTEEPIRTDCGI